MTRADAPADTRMMAIVHRALLRDLDRARQVLAASPRPTGGQRRALGGHLAWMMDFLHAHHRSEDEGLWPLLVQRNPGAAALVASLERDHQRISPAADAVAAAARAYGTSSDDAASQSLALAVGQLDDVLTPHLHREVEEAMPVVARSITRSEWDDVERRFNLSSKSMAQLAMEGHWLLDDLDAEGRDVVVHLVSPIPRLILVHGFARKYRHHWEQCWSPVTPSRSALVS